MARTKAPSSPQRLILDSGAVIAASRNEDRALAFIRRAVDLDAEVRIPVAVLAETMRGGPRDAALHRIVNAVGRCEATSEAIGRLAGQILGRTRRDDTVDALVVAEAVVAGESMILTGDPDDLEALADSHGGVRIIALSR